MSFSLDEKAIILIDYFEELTYKKKQEIIGLFCAPSNIFNNLKNKKEELLSIIDEKLYNNILKNCSEAIVDDYIKRTQKQGVFITTIRSDDYPTKLLQIDTPPFVLYYKGDLSLVDTLAISVVGTRKATIYGKTITENFTKQLVETGFTIISGLALGIDTVAHKTALENNGKTISVVAGGLDNIYPTTNFNLSNEIANKGLVLSEQRLGIKPDPWLFPVRNRIMAGLSKGVLIVEAKEKSGAMHTKNYALDYGKDVFVVPGSILSPESRGCNDIIAKGEGKIVQDIDDILEEYNLVYNKKEDEDFTFTNEEKLIIDVIKDREVSYQEILIKTKLDTKTLNSLLTTLSFRGIIKKLAGNFYCLIYRKED